MEDLAERPERQSVVHHIFDNCRLTYTTVVEPVGVPPEAIGTTQLLVYKPTGRSPVRDACPPTQRHTEQAKLVVDQGSFSYRSRSWREDPEAQFGWGDALEVTCVGEKGEHPFGRQWQAQ